MFWFVITMVEKTMDQTEEALLLGPSTRNQRLSASGVMCFAVRYICITTSFMAWSSLVSLTSNNPNHMFSLQLVFMARINHALHEFTEGFNHHKIRTANNWSPYQMWVNGMLHQDNPLAHGYLGEDPDNV